MTRSTASIVVSISAFLLGVLAVVLCILAYINRIKAEEVEVTSISCSYPNSASFALGIVAAITLLAEQLIISGGIGCFCCGPTKCPSTCSAITSLIFFVLSWLSFMIAFTGLIYTSILNEKSYLGIVYPGGDGNGCKIGQENLFIGGAIWCAVTVVFGLISHTTFKIGSSGNTIHYQRGANYANEQGNVAMGHPQI